MTSIYQSLVTRVSANNHYTFDDQLAIEEPLEIRLLIASTGVSKNISITMRTPGNDYELAAGFLCTEGIINAATDIKNIYHLKGIIPDDQNIIEVALAEHISPDIKKLDRNFYTTSSCGVCGKASIDAVKTVCPVDLNPQDDFTIPASMLYNLPQKISDQQLVFESTGGIHASALFNVEGELLMVREDVGRHNALDKLIGANLSQLPLQKHILLLSGRASFELIQKAAMAQIKCVAAVGAPSSLAVSMAEESGITLIGFLKHDRFNIYTHPRRIMIAN
jgi:FdhD protein